MWLCLLKCMHSHYIYITEECGCGWQREREREREREWEGGRERRGGGSLSSAFTSVKAFPWTFVYGTQNAAKIDKKNCAVMMA